MSGTRLFADYSQFRVLVDPMRKIVLMNEFELTNLLKDIVAIPSVNPAFGGPGESGVAEFVRTWFKRRGIEVSEQPVAEGRSNLLVHCGLLEKPTLLFEAHMDTVGVEGWKEGSPYELVEKEGRYRGRGACDTKASLAVFMALAATLAQTQVEAKYSLLFAATVDEESEQSGAYHLAQLIDEYSVVGAVTGEPTLSNVVSRHKGVCRYRMRFRGKAAHGSTPDLGENAIFKASRVLKKLEALIADIDAGPDEEMLDRSTLNIGEIHGGIGFNVVPDRCEIDLDRRLAIDETPDSARRELESLLGEEEGELITVLERPPLKAIDGSFFSQELLNAARSVDPDLREVDAAYMTNAVAYAEQGIPSLVFGPGDIAQAHKRDEFIRSGEMEKCLSILLTLFGVND